MAPAKRTEEEAELLRASLLEHAQRIVERAGPGALTMRALAAEAGCALGLPYTVFANREEIVGELTRAEYRRLRAEFDAFIRSAGTRTVGENLWSYAELLLRSPAMGLAHELHSAPAIADAVNAEAADIGLVEALVEAVAEYLAAEKGHGRVDPQIDEDAFAFLIAGAIHNLLMAGELYPQPSAERLRAILEAVAARLSPAGEKET